MKRWFSLSLGKLTAIFTGFGVLVAVLAGGQDIFSPGRLSAKSSNPTVSHGGVASHAHIKSCSACHAPAWSRETMADRCLNCHTEIRTQLDASGPLHGRFANGKNCRDCHTEHKGSHASLTDFTLFDHDCTAFKLTGKHRSVACASCHTGGNYKGASHTCVSCHKEPVSHQNRFGSNCAQCHSTLTWSDAKFDHPFPLNHAGAMKKGGCAICHQDQTQFSVYTCYNCHRHEPAKVAQQHARRKVANLEKCADCHFRGRRSRMQALDNPLAPREVFAVDADADFQQAWAARVGGMSYCRDPHVYNAP